jgi:hypothetical protein
MSDRPIIVKPHEIAAPPPRAVTVRNSSLTNALVHQQEAALSLLNMIAPIQLDDVSIDERGNVLIENDAFIKAIRALPGIVKPGEAEAGNFICGLGCGADSLGDIAEVVKKRRG